MPSQNYDAVMQDVAAEFDSRMQASQGVPSGMRKVQSETIERQKERSQ